jgi:D-arabinose 1-dehydrogenase-like Zn-dependent alcohol dehydrogenase
MILQTKAWRDGIKGDGNRLTAEPGFLSHTVVVPTAVNMKITQSSPTLRAGVIGTGFIGPVHVEALRRLGITVSAICDVGDLADKAAAKLGIPRAFAEYSALLACPDVDVVHITTPNRFHCEMSLAALRAGKHVVCEKPLAMNTRETAQDRQAGTRAASAVSSR